MVEVLLVARSWYSGDFCADARLVQSKSAAMRYLVI
jgi:hypothetical protein